jgi:hypothetical protein
VRIKTFTLEQPDDDGEISPYLETIVENPTKEPIRWLQSNAMLVSDQGFPIACTNDNCDDCTIDPGEQFVQRHFIGSVSVGIAGATRDNVGCIVSTTLHARDVVRLGEVDVPSQETGFATIERPAMNKALDGMVKVMVYRQKADEDGDIRIDCRISVQSAADTHLARVELRVDLLDRDECIVESNCDQIALPPRSAGCIEGGIGALKRSQLKDAKLKLSLLVFRPICCMTCTGVSSPAVG